MAKKQFARECTACGKGMNEGYCVENGMEYYCSDECLHTEITPAEWDELYADGEGDSYWTEWDDPDDFDDEDEDEDEDEDKDKDEDDLTEALQDTVAKQSLAIRDLMNEADRLREVINAQEKIIALLKKQKEAKGGVR